MCYEKVQSEQSTLRMRRKAHAPDVCQQHIRADVHGHAHLYRVPGLRAQVDDLVRFGVA